MPTGLGDAELQRGQRDLAREPLAGAPEVLGGIVGVHRPDAAPRQHEQLGPQAA